VIQGQTRNYKPFVSSRVAEIQNNSEPADWSHCPTDVNVADDIRKGISVEEVNVRWSPGPEFLQLAEEQWPTQTGVPDMKELNKEKRKVTITCAQHRFYTVADAAYATGPAPSRAPRFRLKVYDAILLIIIVPTCRVYVPCAAHSLNLVGKSAVSCCLESVGFFGFVQGLYYFLVASTHRWKVVHNRLKKKGLPTVKRQKKSKLD
jgi:hypothetical protein